MRACRTKGEVKFGRYVISLMLLFIATLTTGGLLISNYVSADDSVVDDVNITVPVSCSMSGTGMNSHNANISNGTYQPNIGTTTIHAFCNDNEGFAIYAAGYTGDEIGATNSNKLVGTSASSNSTIDTGLATTAGTPDVSNWAMKLAITQDSGDTTGTNAFTIDSDTEGPFSTYHTVPNTYTKVAHKTAATNMTASTGGVKLTTTYAAYISKNQSADTYSGQVIYTLVHPASHAAPVVLNRNADDISKVTYMQEFAVVSDENRNSIIASMVPEQQYTIKDTRDDKTYTIAKFPTSTNPQNRQITYDVWMTQNLDLDINSNTTYTNEDTDIGYNTSTNSYDTASWTPIRSTYQPTATHTHEWCQGGVRDAEIDYCDANDTPESYDPGNIYWNQVESQWTDWNEYVESCTYGPNGKNCDESKNPLSVYISNTGATQYHLGNYYNWAAALATNDSSTFRGGGLVEQSICPAGWTLPRIGNGEDTFYSLWNQYGFGYIGYDDENYNAGHDLGEDAIWTSPLYFVAGGYFYGYFNLVGYSGSYWSPIPDDVVGARGDGFDVNGFVGLDSVDNWGVASSIRCVLPPVADSYSDDGGGGPK